MYLVTFFFGVFSLILVGCMNPAVRDSYWTINGTRLFVHDTGPLAAPVLIVVHGGPGGNHLNQLPLQRLATRFRVVFYDQRGTGQSDRFNISSVKSPALKELTLEKNREDIESLRKALGKEKIVLLGHSNGGALAVFYAAKYPQHIEKLIVYSGGPENSNLATLKRKNHQSRLTTDEHVRLHSVAQKLDDLVNAGASQEHLDETFAELISLFIPSLYCRPPVLAEPIGSVGFWANFQMSKYMDSFDPESFSKELVQIKAPTLLIWGRCEPSPKERLEYLNRYIPRSKLFVFENSGHNAMDEEPDHFFEILTRFLNVD